MTRIILGAIAILLAVAAGLFFYVIPVRIDAGRNLVLPHEPYVLSAEAQALHDNSIALGSGVVTTRADQIVLGANTQTLTVSGVTSAASSAAQGPVAGVLTTDASGNIAYDPNALTQIASNASAISALQSGSATNADLSALQSDLTDLKSRVTTNTGGISANQSSVSANTSAIAALDAKLAALGATGGASQADVDANTGAIATNRSDIDANTASIASNRTDIDVNTANIADNRSDIDANTANIALNQGDIIANRSDIVLNRGQIASNRTDIDLNASAIAGLRTDVSALQLDVKDLASQFNSLSSQMTVQSDGIAIANALAGSSWLQSDENFALTANWGLYDGSNALAVTATARINTRLSANMGVGYGDQTGRVGARAGLRYGW